MLVNRTVDASEQSECGPYMDAGSGDVTSSLLRVAMALHCGEKLRN